MVKNVTRGVGTELGLQPRAERKPTRSLPLCLAPGQRVGSRDEKSRELKPPPPYASANVFKAPSPSADITPATTGSRPAGSLHTEEPRLREAK